MSRTNTLRMLGLLLCSVAIGACARAAEKITEITDPAMAANDPDFKIQGEYVGEGTWLDGSKTKAGAQVIALGDGKFTVVVTKGGLPGDGWNRGEPRFKLAGMRQDGTTTLSGDGIKGKIVDGDVQWDAITATGAKAVSGKVQVMAITGSDGKLNLQLPQTARQSATEGAKAPEGAVVLFDGTSADQFKHGTLLPDKNLLSGAMTKQRFGDYTLHLEFRLSYMPTARGQARSNSGVYLHDCYEIQVLDSFGLEGEDNECGGFYQLRRPDVNMCYPPLTWQTYDIDFTAPKYEGGKKVANARVAVRQNGVVIHPEMELAHATPGGENAGPAPRPIYFQGHGNKIEYRNIWLKEKK